MKWYWTIANSDHNFIGDGLEQIYIQAKKKKLLESPTEIAKYIYTF